MDKNEQILKNLYNASKSIEGSVFLSEQDLLNKGWVGGLPTQIFKKYGGFWVRLDLRLKKYKVVKIESWMMSKKQVEVDGNAPLPISGNTKFNLKDLYKESLKENK